MSEAEWLGETKCSDTAVSLELLGCTCLSTGLRFLLKRSLSCRFVSPMYCLLHRLHSIMYITFLELQSIRWLIVVVSPVE